MTPSDNSFTISPSTFVFYPPRTLLPASTFKNARYKTVFIHVLYNQQCWVRDSFSRDETETRQLVFKTETRQRHLFSESAETRPRPRQLPSRPRRDNTARDSKRDTSYFHTMLQARRSTAIIAHGAIIDERTSFASKSTSLYGPIRKTTFVKIAVLGVSRHVSRPRARSAVRFWNPWGPWHKSGI